MLIIPLRFLVICIPAWTPDYIIFFALKKICRTYTLGKLVLLETSTDTTWQDPLLFHEETSPFLPYPIEALPSILLDAVQAYLPYGQQPVSLIAGSAIANMSLACQTLANVGRDRLLISPVSLYFLTIASSGERKTGADIIFGSAIREWEEETKEALLPAVQKATTLHQAWRAEKAGLLCKFGDHF